MVLDLPRNPSHHRPKTFGKPISPTYSTIFNFNQKSQKMSGRPRHGTYEQERSYVMTTLHAQIDILKDNYPGSRQMSINSLGNLTNRMNGLRMTGQVKNNYEPSWTEKCNHLSSKISNWREQLILESTCPIKVANDIETTMMFLNFCFPADMHNRNGLKWIFGSRSSDEPRRGDRSGAPSPEPRQHKH
ncbi:uncharacterized protein N7529_009009 [Penicillium soppii]|uniref:uncharacterized protein n=1 Tax=Penicillium soppii TaxID=69789 RepID=UPI00254778B2|nr:uncharacterized protein N7529_009009 [Penicillium soppii]KAJ5861699.1 hypothetical protein N7529_009009 [Penicillium soppii]